MPRSNFDKQREHTQLMDYYRKQVARQIAPQQEPQPTTDWESVTTISYDPATTTLTMSDPYYVRTDNTLTFQPYSTRTYTTTGTYITPGIWVEEAAPVEEITPDPEWDLMLQPKRRQIDV